MEFEAVFGMYGKHHADRIRKEEMSASKGLSA